MAFRPGRWLVLFFTRPIRLSDFSALAARLKPRPKPAVVALPDPIPITRPMPLAMPAASPARASTIEVTRSRPAPSPDRAKPKKDAGPSVASSMFRPELEIGVSEQPIDTLPAALRDELERPSTGGLQGSLRNL